jgi:hypothetical protein
MEFDGARDAQEWRFATSVTVVAMVRAAIATEPRPRTLRQALDRMGRWDACTRRIAQRCGDRGYAQAFTRALRRS